MVAPSCIPSRERQRENHQEFKVAWNPVEEGRKEGWKGGRGREREKEEWMDDCCWKVRMSSHRVTQQISALLPTEVCQVP